MPVTTDPNDPRLTHGPDDEPTNQAEVYLVLSEEERRQGWVRPLREAYVHRTCLTHTRISRPIAETYARNPGFYGATYCVTCRKHLPVAEFYWLDDGTTVGS